MNYKLSENYHVENVNWILSDIYTNNTGVSSYALPLDETDRERVSFNKFIDGIGLTESMIIDPDYATAYLRVYEYSLKSCNNDCLCIPEKLSILGFGATVEKKTIFSYKASDTSCCNEFNTTATVSRNSWY